MKKVIAMFLCLAMLFTALPAVWAEETDATEPGVTEPAVTEPAPTEPTQPTQPTEPAEPTEPADPAEPEEEEPVVNVRPPRPTKENMPGISDSELLMEQLAWDTFTACQKTAGRQSFHGHCGNFVSHQLLNLGINRYKSTRHGKDHYDYYSKLTKTTGGYFPRGIPTEEIHLGGALNYITDQGSKDVYNVLVGFDWTNTEAGNKYGHVVLIYAILGGVVYFSESFDLYYQWKTYPEGSLIRLSIEEFVDYYDGWTRYEGIVTLSTQNYTEFCKQENTNLMVQTRFDTVLRSQPCQLGLNKSELVRNISAGERLQASGVFTNGYGEIFYRIADGEQVGFVSANAVSVLQANPFNCYIQDLNMPQVLPLGEDFQLTGTVAGEYAKVREVTVRLVDTNNKVLQEATWENFSNRCSLEKLNDKLDFSQLPAGFYILRVLASVKCTTADGELMEGTARLGGVYFQVGGEQFISRAMPALRYQDTLQPEGWEYEGGWYFYENGEVKTGWFTWCGVQYYFDESGRAATGWVTIDEKLHYFSASGCLVKNATLKQGKTTYEIDAQGVATQVSKKRN